jgi:hypothetical protein
MDYVIAVAIIIIAGYFIWGGKSSSKTGPATGGDDEPTSNQE